MLMRLKKFIFHPKRYRTMMCSLVGVTLVCMSLLSFISGYAASTTFHRYDLEVERNKFDTLAALVIERLPVIIEDVLHLKSIAYTAEEVAQERERRLEKLQAEVDKVRSINTPTKTKKRPLVTPKNPISKTLRLNSEAFKPIPLTEKELEDMYGR